MNNTVTFEFLGTGTSTGVPEIGCHCPVCSSADHRDNRLRTSFRITSGNDEILIDTPPDLRFQCLRSKITNLEAVLITHLHADHIFGLDDVRKFNILHKKDIDIYLFEQHEARFRELFDYTLSPPVKGLSRPQFQIKTVNRDSFKIKGINLTPLPVMHGSEEIRGYLIEAAGHKLACITDCKVMPEETKKLINGCDVLILNALWRGRTHRKHPNHLDLEDAIQVAHEVGAKKTFFTHLSHFMGLHEQTDNELPAGFHLAYDGLRITFSTDGIKLSKSEYL